MADVGAVGPGMSISLLHDLDQFHVLIPLVIEGITADLQLQRRMVGALVQWTLHAVGQGVQGLLAAVLLDRVHVPLGILPFKFFFLVLWKTSFSFLINEARRK